MQPASRLRSASGQTLQGSCALRRSCESILPETGRRDRVWHRGCLETSWHAGSWCVSGFITIAFTLPEPGKLANYCLLKPGFGNFDENIWGSANMAMHFDLTDM